MVLDMWPFATSLISKSLLLFMYWAHFFYVFYAAGIDDKAGNSVVLLLGLTVFKFQPGDHVQCRDPSCLSNDPEEKCCDG
jgi:hypothetical protein